ncbi:MAG TPA: hypothetical protein VHC20_06150 [Candidatus Paceibacterota bacterium]|jgi:hypothetical protein|nr:hypothetical protein [Candidatus Paceibacterota bacterium]
MANKIILKDCYIVVNGTNLSDHVSAVSVNLSKDDVETTSFSGGGRERMQGLKDDSFELTLQQDFDAASVDSVFYPLYDTGDEFEVEVRPTSSAVSATNPSYTGDCILMEYSPLDGKVGDLSETKVKIPTQRTGITRATS